MTNLIYKDEVYAIMGAAFEVYNKLGQGFLEAVYQEALAFEFGLRNISFQEQQDILIHYKGHALKQSYRADYLVFGKIIVEIKAIDKLTGREEAQLLNYLKATGFDVGVLLNFGASHEMQWKRFANTNKS